MSAEAFNPESPNPGNHEQRLVEAVEWIRREIKEQRDLKVKALQLRDIYPSESDFYLYYHKQAQDCQRAIDAQLELLAEVTGLSIEQLAGDI